MLALTTSWLFSPCLHVLLPDTFLRLLWTWPIVWVYQSAPEAYWPTWGITSITSQTQSASHRKRIRCSSLSALWPFSLAARLLCLYPAVFYLLFRTSTRLHIFLKNYLDFCWRRFWAKTQKGLWTSVIRLSYCYWFPLSYSSVGFVLLVISLVRCSGYFCILHTIQGTWE